MNTASETFGDFIREQRINLGRSQAEMARATQIDPSFYSRLETGGIRKPKQKTLKRLSVALGIPLDELNDKLTRSLYLPIVPETPPNIYSLLVSITKSGCEEISPDDLYFLIATQKGLEETMPPPVVKALLECRRKKPPSST